jgi:hydroxymethylpyrimidine pyrophosphatase-like HAD family hydrolase
MHHRVLACDYDGTLARDGQVEGETVDALKRLLASGRVLLLVTGRELDQLISIFPEISIFSHIVAENGAVLYRPSIREEKVLCEPPPADFVPMLKARGVAPISVGRVIVATWRPNETTVLRTIRDLGLEMQVIFNKDAVMVLPSGVNKGTGLTAALNELRFTAREVVGVGDAENDHSFLNLCGRAAAVANALPSVKDEVDIVLQRDHGAGVVDLIDHIVANDLAELETKSS